MRKEIYIIASVFAIAILSVSSTFVASPAIDTRMKAKPLFNKHLPLHPPSGGITRDSIKEDQPLTPSQCRAKLGTPCYGPDQYIPAYNLNPLYQQGIDGRGRNIVIVDSFGSPTIQNDLNVFNAKYHLPAINVNVVKIGNIPPFDPNNDDMTGWAMETTLDVEYAHAIAPKANITLVETPVAETQGMVGFPEMMQGEKQVMDSMNVDVISQSFGATEETFPGFKSRSFKYLNAVRYAFKEAQQKHVTVLASSGDSGAANVDENGHTYKFPTNTWPSSDKLVTSIGGTTMDLDDRGKRLSEDVTWNDNNGGATGGGISHIFRRGHFQNSVKSSVGRWRGTPDVSMSASNTAPAWIYDTALPKSAQGWHLIAGTSEAAPIFSGIVALAAQKAGHSLGNINEALYHLNNANKSGQDVGIMDITKGNNSNLSAGVKGYDAAKYYDLATGIGTVGDATKFVPALAEAVDTVR